jgi:hypothetical protein
MIVSLRFIKIFLVFFYLFIISSFSLRLSLNVGVGVGVGRRSFLEGLNVKVNVSRSVNASFTSVHHFVGATTFGMMTFSIMTFSIMTLSIMTQSIMILRKRAPFSIITFQHSE